MIARRACLFLLMTLLLAACGPARAEQRPAEPTATAAVAVVPTEMAPPTATASPTRSPSPSPSATATATATRTATATATASATATTPPTATALPPTATTAPPPPTAPPAPQPVTVDIQLFQYQPATLQIPAGTTVRWTNRDEIEHTVTSGSSPDPDGRFDSGFFTVGQSYERSFMEPGSYSYFCLRHPSMQGTVVVSP